MTQSEGFAYFPPTMVATLRALVAVFASAALALLAAAGPAVTLEPLDGLLVLRSGEVIAGRITPSGDRYLVQVPGGQLRVEAARVDFTCRTLDEAYHMQRARLAPRDIRGRLHLARWCLKQQLPGHAARELTEVLRLDPRHPEVGPLADRLELLLQQATAADTAAEDEDVCEPDDPSGGPAIPTASELDRLVRSLPGPAVEMFTLSIQPLLVNRCTTSGCHTTRSDQALQLLTARRPSRRLTQRNLYALLQYVDTQRPDESPLLTVPSRPHGTVRVPLLAGLDDGHFVQVQTWLRLLAAPVEARQPRSVRFPSRAGQPQPPPTAAPRSDDSVSPSQADDPFDPDAFNRQSTSAADAPRPKPVAGKPVPVAPEAAESEPAESEPAESAEP